MHIVLVAGLWLDSSAWDTVAARLRAAGHVVVAVPLPGQGAPPENAGLGDQLAAVVAAIDAASSDVLLVGHSAACTLVWMAADRRPERVARVVMIGGFPSGDGDAYADFFEIVDGVMPFPGWEPFEGPDSADLDAERRAAIAAAALAVPEAVAKGIVRLSDVRRNDVPVTVICPEFTPAEARGAVEGGEVPELARAGRVDYVDIDSGHWPMFTRPEELADLLAAAAVPRFTG
jgi:pimeloyl-ACP methyl ester carboxylesterase